MNKRTLRWLAGVLVTIRVALPDSVVETPELWKNLTARAFEAYNQGAYGDAHALFESALRQAGTFGEGDDRLAASWNNLGTACRALGRYAKAEKLYRIFADMRVDAQLDVRPDLAQFVKCRERYSHVIAHAGLAGDIAKAQASFGYQLIAE